MPALGTRGTCGDLSGGHAWAPRWSSWAVAPSLEAGVVHLWRAGVRRNAALVPRLGRVLSPEERARADRFLRTSDRVRYIMARGLLRFLIGRYLGADPVEIRFARGPHGKPSLAGRGDPGGLRFNLSHSGDVVLWAFARSREVGVDVERVRPGPDLLRLAERALSPAQVATLRSLRPEDQARAFFVAWTRKEAYLKARGEGLGGAPQETPRGEEALEGRWLVWDIQPARGYVGALCVEDTGGGVQEVAAFDVSPDVVRLLAWPVDC